jgi:hypothetical protein
MRNHWVSWLIFGMSLGLTMLVFVIFAHQIDIENNSLAYDWKIIWRSIENGRVHWGDGMYNPPWTVLFILPLGFLSLQTSWGIVMFLTLAVLIASVPTRYPRWKTILATLLLVTSFPVLRALADSNLEAMTIGGILLVSYAYRQQQPYMLALGVLIAAAKPQAVSLLIGVLVIYCLRSMPRQIYLKAGFITLAVFIPAMLWGGEAWLGNLDSSLPPGISLQGTTETGDFPVWLIRIFQIGIISATLLVAYWGNQDLGRVKVGMLVAASLLVSPYTNSHSITAVLAIGIIAILLEKPLLGLPLVLLYNLPFAFRELNLGGDATQLYWTGLLLLSWITLAGWNLSPLRQSNRLSLSFDPS